MTGEIIDLGAKRKPIVWHLRITQGFDGSLSMEIGDVADDARSRAAVALAILRLGDEIREGRWFAEELAAHPEGMP